MIIKDRLLKWKKLHKRQLMIKIRQPCCNWHKIVSSKNYPLGSHYIGVCMGYNWLLDFQPKSKMTLYLWRPVSSQPFNHYYCHYVPTNSKLVLHLNLNHIPYLSSNQSNHWHWGCVAAWPCGSSGSPAVAALPSVATLRQTSGRRRVLASSNMWQHCCNCITGLVTLFFLILRWG